MNSQMLEGTTAGAVLRGQAAIRDLQSGIGLRDAAEMVLTAAVASGFPLLVPASPHAGTLVGATVLLGDGGVRSAMLGDVELRGGKALVVETVAVSGLSVREQVRNLRFAGTDWIGVVVWRVEGLSGCNLTDWGDIDFFSHLDG
jgi:hypothetical protein